MKIVQFPDGRYSGSGERVALRAGLAVPIRRRAALRLAGRRTPAADHCARYAAPIDVGAVWRGEDAFCSVECSLGGTA